MALIRCLRELVGREPGAARPTLVLNGDILEFALAPDNVAAMVFDRFVDLAFDPEDPLFDPTVIYLPGNHDHHIWETARERMYAAYVARTPAQDPLAPPWHATPLFATFAGDGPRDDNRSAQEPEAELLNALVRRRRGQRLRVQVVYPNLGLRAGSGRTVLIHHGHFTEPLYRLMSTAKMALFPKQPPGRDIWDWESDNFAWIDFFWSTLGRSGSAGEDVGLVYDMLGDEHAMKRLASEIGSLVGNRGFRPTRFASRWLGRKAAEHLVTYVNNRERHHPEVVLTDSGARGLHDYVAGPLARQFQHESKGEPSTHVSFIFGHTHKPFESTLDVSAYPGLLSVFNSGGWVVDTAPTNPNQGAAVLLVDDACNVVSLRVYNQATDPSAYAVSVAAPPDGAGNELHDRVSAALDPRQAPWSDLSAAVAAEVALRHRLLPTIVQRGLTFTSP